MPDDELPETSGFGPCSTWITTEDIRTSPVDFGDSDIGEELLQQQIDAAQEALYLLSGRQFPGVCSDVIRPYEVCTDCYFNRRSRSGLPNCLHNRIVLAGYPVIDVSEVKVDGEVLDAAQYRIDNQKYLVRLPETNGQRLGWPQHQDLLLETDQVDTFEVSYRYGKNPPELGKQAAIELAAELALASVQSDKCRLDRRVTQLARQGVTIALPGLIDALKDHRTGLPKTDFFIETFNPNRLGRRATVLIPEKMARVQRS